MTKVVSFFGDQSETFEKLNRRAAEYAAAKGLDYEWVPLSRFSEDAVVSALNGADAGIIDVEPYGESIFSRLPDQVKLLVRFGVGYDKVDVEAATRHGIAIARTVGANTMGVAEMAITLLLATRRQLKRISGLVDEGDWQKVVVNETVGGTVGIMGFGSIGRALAKLLTGFDCEILAYDPFLTEADAVALGVRSVDLKTLFAESDAISVHVPYSEATHHIVSDDLLGLMKPSAVIVNTARGNLIDEDALYRVCRDGRIRGAALDVFAEEPLPLTSPLLGLDNVILTPHLSSQTEESLWRIYAMAIDIAADFFAGDVPRYVLNPEAVGTPR